MSNVTKRELIEENEELVGALEGVLDALAAGNVEAASEIATEALGPEDEDEDSGDEDDE
mgnify:CR=1 FL=1